MQSLPHDLDRVPLRREFRRNHVRLARARSTDAATLIWEPYRLEVSARDLATHLSV